MTEMPTDSELTRAARGDLWGLRDLRERLVMVAIGEASMNMLSRREALIKAEIVGQLAALRGGPVDLLSMVAIYHLRIADLTAEVDRLNIEGEGATAAKDSARFDRVVDDIMACGDRKTGYHAQIEWALDQVMASGDPDALALLIRAADTNANRGHEWATPFMQQLLDAMTPDKARRVSKLVRSVEAVN